MGIALTKLCAFDSRAACTTAASLDGRARVLVTDGAPVVVRLLRETVALPRSHKNLRASTLLWGNAASLRSTLERHGAPDVILGADVVLWPAYVRPLLATVRALMLAGAEEQGSCEMLLAYVERATSTTDRLVGGAREFGLALRRVSDENFST